MNRTDLLQAIVWISLAVIAYGYVVYPALIWVLSRVFGRTEKFTCQISWPTLSIVIVACDEQDVIAARIENALQTDYPRDLLEIVIASDGSSDATEAIVKRFSPDGVKLFASSARRGKAAALNDLIPRVRGEIVFLSDSNTFADPLAASRLVARFGDSRVGAVCGRLILQDSKESGNTDGLYWKYETFLKRCESHLGALVGANGAIYAIRRSFFRPIPENMMIDDFSIPLLMRLQTGARIVYADDAIATEQTAKDVKSEFMRRTRIGAGTMQALRLVYPLLHPKHGWIAFSFFSHKVVRWICPWCLLAMFIASNLLALSHRGRIMLLAQILFYAVSLLPMVIPVRWRFVRILRLPQMFTGMNIALMLGFWRYAIAGANGAWQRTAR
jgi:cellulose synthase/poly-beta-1,6-N-acetylglucosamine synthase-like glycosyltransferase